MKKDLHPAVVAATLIVAMCVIGFLLWRGTSGDAADVPPGGIGNPGPFSPGGSQVGKSGRPATNASSSAPSGNTSPGAGGPASGAPASTGGAEGR